MDSGNSAEYNSKDIASTKSKQKVDQFVDGTAITSSRKNKEKEQPSRPPFSFKEFLKKHVLGIVIFLVLAVAIALGIIFLPPYFRKQEAVKETNELSDETDAYLEYMDRVNALIDKNQAKEFDKVDNPEENILNYLKEHEDNENEPETMKALNALFRIYTGYDDKEKIASLIPVFDDFRTKVNDKQNKAIIEARLAELYYRIDDKDNARHFYEEAVLRTDDEDSIHSLTGKYFDMVAEFHEDDVVQTTDEEVPPAEEIEEETTEEAQTDEGTE